MNRKGWSVSLSHVFYRFREERDAIDSTVPPMGTRKHRAVRLGNMVSFYVKVVLQGSIGAGCVQKMNPATFNISSNLVT